MTWCMAQDTNRLLGTISPKVELPPGSFDTAPLGGTISPKVELPPGSFDTAPLGGTTISPTHPLDH